MLNVHQRSLGWRFWYLSGVAVRSPSHLGNAAPHWLDSPHAPDEQVKDHPDFRDAPHNEHRAQRFGEHP